MFTTTMFDLIRQLNIVTHPMVWILAKNAIAFTFGDWSLVIVLCMLVLDFTKFGIRKSASFSVLFPLNSFFGLVMQEYSNKVIAGKKFILVQQDV